MSSAEWKLATWQHIWPNEKSMVRQSCRLAQKERVGSSRSNVYRTVEKILILWLCSVSGLRNWCLLTKSNFFKWFLIERKLSGKDLRLLFASEMKPFATADGRQVVLYNDAVLYSIHAVFKHRQHCSTKIMDDGKLLNEIRCLRIEAKTLLEKTSYRRYHNAQRTGQSIHISKYFSVYTIE